MGLFQLEWRAAIGTARGKSYRPVTPAASSRSSTDFDGGTQIARRCCAGSKSCDRLYHGYRQVRNRKVNEIKGVICSSRAKQNGAPLMADAVAHRDAAAPPLISILIAELEPLEPPAEQVANAVIL